MIDFKLGDWLVEVDRNHLKNDRTGERKSIEPKVMQLLVELSRAHGGVVSRQRLIVVLWPDVIVGEDTLARTVSRLRTALGDSASASKYIQTIPKKGYALNVKPEVTCSDNANDIGGGFSWKRHTFAFCLLAILGVICVLSFEQAKSLNSDSLKRAEDFYMKFTHEDNEAAISLYERMLRDSPDDTVAQAGLANSLVQRVVRWPKRNSVSQLDEPSIRNALTSGQLETPEAVAILSRAQAFAERAVRLAPEKAEALKSLGLVYSAQGKLEEAAATYEQAIELDSSEWRSLINLGEIKLIWGEPDKAIIIFIRAFEVMGQRYDVEPQHIGPWQPAVGLLVAQLHQERGAILEAERWFNTVLTLAPLEREATRSLIAILKNRGDIVEANELCAHFTVKLGSLEGCE